MIAAAHDAEPFVAQGRDALAGLERVLASGADGLGECMAEAVRHLVAVRDTLIGEQRRGGPSAELNRRLDGTNAVLSCVIGAEFPLGGLHRDRVRMARDALAKLLAQEAHPHDSRA